MSEATTGYAMWNPSFLKRTWNKRRAAAGLGENPSWRDETQEARHRYYVTHKANMARPAPERAAEVAMKLTDAELAALLAGFGEAVQGTPGENASRGDAGEATE